MSNFSKKLPILYCCRIYTELIKLSALAILLAIASCGIRPTDNPEESVDSKFNIQSSAIAETSTEHIHVLAKYGGVYQDENVEKVVAGIVGRLVANTDDPTKFYRVTILNSPDVNAFALPGGHIYLTRGLLALANDTSEVAAVVAHEIGHIIAGHALARLRRAEDADFANRVILSVVEDPTAAELAVQKSLLSFAKFSRTQELHADVIGVQTVARAQYDPHSTARFLELRENYSQFVTAGRATNSQTDYLATHPSTPERVIRAKFLARQYGSPGIGERGQIGYLKGIDGILYGDDPQGGVVRGNNFFQKSMGVTFTIPDGFLFERSPKSIIFSHSEGAAFRFDGIELGRDESLFDYVASGWINGLVGNSIRPISVNGLPAVTASANVEGRAFRIAVVRVGELGYRFIAATRHADESFEISFISTVESFRQLTPNEISQLKPLKIRIVEAKFGDTPVTLARQMAGIQASHRLELFIKLNGVRLESEIPEGKLVKVVVEQQ